MSLLMAVAACGSAPGLHSAGAPPAPAGGSAPEPYLWSVAAGSRVELSELVAAASEARVVYVGEEHDQARDHELQRRVFDALGATPGAPVGLGLEMVQRPYQEHLDAFSRGELDLGGLRRALEWDERWGFGYGFYAPMLAMARDRGARIIALNAPQSTTRTVARQGLEGLAPDVRASLPELDLADDSHRSLILDALRSHDGMTEESLERFYIAQVIWDETMAETVARETDGQETDAAPRMVVLAGGMHVRQGLGIPRRAARRGAEPFLTVMPVSPEDLEEAIGATPPWADYLFVRGRDAPRE